ncbi:MAG: hypothetical protein WCW53_11890 [Syntrophales bacterium]|jgi:hypothetical protein
MKFAKEISVFLCDDIRQEVGNKVSLMGIYGKDVILPEIPFIFSKLCLLLSAKEVKRVINDLKVVIITPQNEQITLEIPAPPNQKVPQDIQIGITMSPLNIKEEGEGKIEIFEKEESKPFISHHFNLKKHELGGDKRQ